MRTARQHPPGPTLNENGSGAVKPRGKLLAMSRRRELKGIVAGLLGSFVSRNNDVAGFWAIGKLHSYARNHQTSEVLLDLLAQSVVPSSTELQPMLKKYGASLESRIASCGLSSENVLKAVVRLAFDAAVSDDRPPSSLPGTPFRCTVELADDLGRIYSQSHLGVARPHDSARETRSTRQ
jgi:hypothetical protein